MAAVTIGFSTGVMIRSLVADIVLPTIYKLFLFRVKFVSGAFAPISNTNIDTFIKEFISWIFVIIITYLLIEYALRQWVFKKPYSPPFQETIQEQEKRKNELSIISSLGTEAFRSR
jgi:large-conductance mechanosensitive channel